jgi:hypothetical protein
VKTQQGEDDKDAMKAPHARLSPPGAIPARMPTADQPGILVSRKGNGVSPGFTWAHRRRGDVFQGQFKSLLIRDETRLGKLTGTFT